MTELLCALKGLVVGVAESVWGLIAVVGTSCYDILYHLHTTAPRLEGLLIGVALAWLLLRRERHPVLRVLSSPLKLVLDILDLAWDQVVEVYRDCWEALKRWAGIPIGWIKSKATSLYGWVTSGLIKVKDSLTKKKDKE